MPPTGAPIQAFTNALPPSVLHHATTGIPDFRGQRGVWTLEEQGQPLPEYERCWDNAVPTLGHMALVGLVKEGLVHAIISQNVDGEKMEGRLEYRRNPRAASFCHRCHRCWCCCRCCGGCYCWCCWCCCFLLLLWLRSLLWLWLCSSLWLLPRLFPL